MCSGGEPAGRRSRQFRSTDGGDNASSPERRVPTGTTGKVMPNDIIVLDDANRDFREPAAQAFLGWETVRLRGFERRHSTVWETTCFSKPA
jgi:hypothetical protein